MGIAFSKDDYSMTSIVKAHSRSKSTRRYPSSTVKGRSRSHVERERKNILYCTVGRTCTQASVYSSPQ